MLLNGNACQARLKGGTVGPSDRTINFRVNKIDAPYVQVKNMTWGGRNFWIVGANGMMNPLWCCPSIDGQIFSLLKWSPRSARQLQIELNPESSPSRPDSRKEERRFLAKWGKHHSILCTRMPTDMPWINWHVTLKGLNEGETTPSTMSLCAKQCSPNYSCWH